MNHTDRVLIVGASGRAAAASALRTGIKPRCVDHFADCDLRALCPVDHVMLEEGPPGLECVALNLPSSAWLYTGPLENHPDRVERLSRTHRLLGNPAEAMCAVRNPFRVSEVLGRTELKQAEVRPDSVGLPRDETWLVKPFPSGRGRYIQHLVLDTVLPPEPCYFQRLVAGPSFSSLFLRAWAIGAHRRVPAAHRIAGIALRLSRQHRPLRAAGPNMDSAGSSGSGPHLDILPGRAVRSRSCSPGRRAVGRRDQSAVHRVGGGSGAGTGAFALCGARQCLPGQARELTGSYEIRQPPPASPRCREGDSLRCREPGCSGNRGSWIP